MIDRQEFERACMPSYGRVLQLCERMLGHRQQAEELTQETFLRAFEKRSSFRGQAQVGTWLLSIAHRLSWTRVGVSSVSPPGSQPSYRTSRNSGPNRRGSLARLSWGGSVSAAAVS